MDWIFDNPVTAVVAAVIIIAFAVFLLKAVQLKQLSEIIRHALGGHAPLEELSQGRLKLLCDEYQATLTVQTPDGIRTSTPAAEVFSQFGATKAAGINLRLLDAASSTLVGLGLFGTFLGLMIGVTGFNSSDSQGIQDSINTLLSGMATAFLTSLLGMGLSLTYTMFFDKPWRNGLMRCLYDLNQRLDAQYYIDDMSLARLNQGEMDERVKSIASDIVKELRTILTYVDTGGNEVTVGNAVREVLGENREQTRALKTFSTDLADRINDGFDNVLSSQMEEKLLPLMTNIDTTTKALVGHIDKMADKVTTPAADMMGSMVEELKGSMVSAVDAFKSSISEPARQELENVIAQLAVAAKAMDKFPDDIREMTSSLQSTTDEVRTAVADMSKTSAEANELGARHLADSSDEMRRLMAAFGQSIDRQTSLNESVNQTLGGFKQAQDEITRSTLNLRTISDQMRMATEQFARSQAQGQETLSRIQIETQQSIDSLTQVLSQSGQLSKENAEKFDVIRQGLAQVFAQLQGGLTQYSETVRSSTQKYLDQYSTSLSAVAENLNSAIQLQNENIDVLTEALQSAGKKS